MDRSAKVRAMLREMDPAEQRAIASYIGNLLRPDEKKAAPSDTEALQRRIDNLLNEVQPWRR